MAAGREEDPQQGLMVQRQPLKVCLCRDGPKNSGDHAEGETAALCWLNGQAGKQWGGIDTAAIGEQGMNLP